LNENKKRQPLKSAVSVGGGERIRTDDPLRARQNLNLIYFVFIQHFTKIEKFNP